MRRPWMPLYIADYKADTSHLNAAEHGAYLLLIMHYWQHGSLPDDDDRLARIAAGMPIDQWKAMRQTIQAFFSDGWFHKRIEAEFHKSRERSAAGQLGGRPKANSKQNESKSEAPHPHPQEEKNLFGDGGVGEEGKSGEHRPLRHGLISKKHGTVFVKTGTSDWDVYAQDFEAVRGAKPIPNRHGGFWFCINGEAARERRKRA